MRGSRMGVLKPPAVAAAIGCLVLMLAGCATLEHGQTDQVYVLSDPPGADVTVSFSDQICKTPCTLDAPRGQAFTVVLEKPGYDSQTVAVATKSLAPASATSEDLTADYVGRIIDNRSDADTIHVPDPVSVKLKPSK
jgi:hypothetical protein